MSRRLQNLLLVVGSAVVCAALMELGLHVVGFSAPSFYEPDRFTGARHRPGAEGWDRREGETYVRISAQGLRDRDHREAKPPGTVRIVVLGDSYAEGLAVELDQTFWSVAAADVASCPALAGRTIEPINLGVSGYGPAQELLALRHRGFAFDPDLVVTAFFSENDVRDDSRALSREPLRPYYTLQDGLLQLDDRFLASSEYRLKAAFLSRLLYGAIDRVRLLQLANLAKNNLRRRWVLHQDPSASGVLEPPDHPVRHPLYSEPTDPRWRDAWAVTEALIAETARETASHGARFVLMSVSNPVQVHPDAALRGRFESAYGVADLFEPERRLGALARREGLPYLPLAPGMQAEADRTGTFFHGFARIGTEGRGHWNVQGHRFAGHALAERLCAILTSSASDAVRARTGSRPGPT